MSEQSLQTKIALLEAAYQHLKEEHKEAIERLKEEHEELKRELENLKKDNDELKSMASRWKGFGAALIALGATASFIATQYDHLKIFLGFVAKTHGQ